MEEQAHPEVMGQLARAPNQAEPGDIGERVYPEKNLSWPCRKAAITLAAARFKVVMEMMRRRFTLAGPLPS